MRIGVLTTSFPRYDGDVAGAFVLGFVRTLVRHGHTVDVVAPEPDDHFAPPSWPGVQVHWVSYLRPRSLQRTFYGAGVADNLGRDPVAWAGGATFFVAMRNRVRDLAPSWDAVVSHWAFPLAFAGPQATAMRPHLAVFHSADVHALERVPGGATAARALRRRASALWFVSPALADRFRALLPTPQALGSIHVAPMGIDAPGGLPNRDAARRALHCSDFTVLSLGRLVPIKGLPLLVDAAARLRDKGVEVLVAGDGPDRVTLEQRARRLGAPVRFLGAVAGEAKARVLAAADAFAFTSADLPSGRTEGMPTTVLEAMAAGLPTIATAVGGLSGTLSKDDVLWLHRRSPDDLAEHILRLRDDTALRSTLADKGRVAAAKLTWDALAPGFLPLLGA